jgi:hypothetical protein
MGIYGNTYIIENANKDKRIIKDNLYIIYGHLLKYLSIDPKLPGWIGSIFSTCSNIQKINTTSWNMLTSKDIEESKTRGIIDVYYKDNNPQIDFDKLYSIIDKDFSNCRDFQDSEKIYKFLLNNTKNIDFKNYLIHYYEKKRR